MEDIKSYGDLKKIIKDIINEQKLQKVGGVSVDAIIENNILYEQLLQEAFLDSVKAYAQEKYDKVVDKISDWKEAAAIIGNVISNPEILQRFSDDVWYNFKSGTLKRLIALLNKIGLGDLVTQINNIVTKITNLNGWQKFLAATGIGAIAEYVVNKMASLAPDAIKKFISSYLSEDGLKSIISKLTDFKSYLGWLQPIIKGVDMLYAVLKNSISKFKTGIFAYKINFIKKEGINENMNAKLIDNSKNKYKGKSVSGIAESKKRKDILKEKIKEYVVKRLKKEITNPENPDGVLNIPKNNKTAIEKAKKDNKQFTTY